MEFWKTINNVIILYDSTPADCLVKVVRRNLDDTEAEILYENEQPEERDVPRVDLKDNPAVKAERERSGTQRENLNEINDLMGFSKKPSNKTRIDKHLFLFWCIELCDHQQKKRADGRILFK